MTGDPIATPLDESVDSAEAAKDEALADLQAKAEDLKSDERLISPAQRERATLVAPAAGVVSSSAHDLTFHHC